MCTERKDYMKTEGKEPFASQGERAFRRKQSF